MGFWTICIEFKYLIDKAGCEFYSLLFILIEPKILLCAYPHPSICHGALKQNHQPVLSIFNLLGVSLIVGLGWL